MKHLCTTCDLAIWKRTKAGRLHPDGAGRCGWHKDSQPIPAAYYWIQQPRMPSGGYISRNPTGTGDEPIEQCTFYKDANR